MANLYRRKGSPFFWITYRDSQGTTRQESTGLRHHRDYPLEIRRARAMQAQRTADEIARPAKGRKSDGQGWSWVPNFLSIRYGESPGTLIRFRNDWKTLLLFLEDHRITSPTALSRQHCYEYVAWRAAEPAGTFKACHNTALHELHVLSVLMQEAINRKMVNANPCSRLGIRKQQTKRKPELTPDDDEAIRKNIPKVKSKIVREMLHASFEIARYQGARLNETRLDLRNDVNLQTRTITFRTKTRKVHTTALHPTLIPLFKKLIRDGKTHSWQMPDWAPPTWPAKKWHEFLTKIGLTAKGISFHSTRVTVISQMARRNVSMAKAMEFVCHASSSIHAIYRRLQPADLSDCTKAIR